MQERDCSAIALVRQYYGIQELLRSHWGSSWQLRGLAGVGHAIHLPLVPCLERLRPRVHLHNPQ